MTDLDSEEIRRYYDQSLPTDLTPPPPTPAPTITTLAPATSVIGVEVTVTVTGTGFVDGSTILADGSPLPTVFVSSTSLTVTGTPLVDGSVVVTVRNPDGRSSNGLTFTVTAVAGDEEQADEEPET